VSRQVIEVVLSGGIGNQLFQYAAGRFLSEKLLAPLRFDISWYLRNNDPQKTTKREFVLPNLLLTKKLEVCSSPLPKKGFDFYRRFENFKLINDLSQSVDNFQGISTMKPVRLSGYWQSFGYFDRIENLLRTEINQTPEYSKESKELLNKISSTKSLGLHVRRGDYVSLSNAALFHGVCKPEYYIASVDEMRRLTGVDSVIIFSDDMKWCKENLEFSSETIYVDESIPDIDQLKLMSHCSNQIISNSSFSWWAAWLGKSVGQKVIYPKTWFADGRGFTGVPDNWISR
jgi:hypothetical protein